MTINSIDKFIQDNNITHIYLDIDGVLFASCQACADILNEMQGTDFNGSDVLSWDFKNICPNITLEEINDYKIYPVADNDTPKLSADRLEYTFSDALTMTNSFSLEDIKEIYENLKVLKNEDGIDEIGFTDLKIAEKFEYGASKLWFLLQSNKDKLKCQFIADTIKKMNEKGLIYRNDLYKYSEQEILDMIENCQYKEISETFKRFRKVLEINEGEVAPKDKYSVSLKVKKRYIIALVNEKRIIEISEKIKKLVEEFSNFKSPTYGWFDF